MDYCKIKRKSVWSYALTLLIAGAVLMTAPISVWAAHLGAETGHPSSTSRSVEDVKNTMHNLSLSNPISGVNIGTGTSSTTEVCAFCHTPHGANTGAPGAAPLWNRAIPTTAGYTTYSGPNFDGVTIAPVGVSLACLSCHDGTIGLDALINMPGSGGFKGLTPASSGLIGEGATSDFLGTGNVMSGTTRDTGGGKNYAAMTGAAPFPNLTQNLSDDHPISFAFQALVNPDPQFDDVTVTDSGSVSLIGNTATGKTNAPVDRRDRLRLYPANGLNDNGAGSKQDWVECASCHNPHAPRPLFLRLPLGATAYAVKGGGTLTVSQVVGSGGSGLIADDPNAGSAVCISCHEK
jgi:hypothetical protein